MFVEVVTFVIELQVLCPYEDQRTSNQVGLAVKIVDMDALFSIDLLDSRCTVRDLVTPL